jgi:DNA (cytosine-5)-methyltransferase 1
MNYIDLFAGAGGLSEGFIKAGFKPIAHVEKDKSACFTLKTRLAFYYLKGCNRLDVYNNYIQGNLTREQLYSSIPKSILNSVLNFEISEITSPTIFSEIDVLKGTEEVDLIIGGPPCQAYSNVGRPALKHKEDDERKLLYLDYARFLRRYQPKVFVFENVPGLYTLENGKYYKNLRKYFKRIGYCVEDQVLDASDFGVVQKRKRIIIVGWRKELNFSYPNFITQTRKWIVKDIFSDLPSLTAGEMLRTAPYKSPANDYLNRFGIRNGLGFVTQNYTRAHNTQDLLIYALAISTLKDQNKRIKNHEIPKSLRTQNNITSFLDRFKVVNENDCSHTVLAHIAKDGHYSIHPDIEQLRSISVREAARIQSFPDDYFFEGTNDEPERTSAFRQIGNAVPPLLAHSIAIEFKNLLQKL